MTANPMIFIPQDDYRRLRTLATVSARRDREPGARAPDAPSLLDELERATVLEREQMPSDVVTVNSRVRFEDSESGVAEEYVLTWPENADGGVERISVLAPIGTALLGYRKGDEISWPTPGGTRRLHIVDVEPLPEDALADPREAALARLLYGRG